MAKARPVWSVSVIVQSEGKDPPTSTGSGDVVTVSRHRVDHTKPYILGPLPLSHFGHLYFRTLFSEVLGWRPDPR